MIQLFRLKGLAPDTTLAPDTHPGVNGQHVRTDAFVKHRPARIASRRSQNTVTIATHSTISAALQKLNGSRTAATVVGIKTSYIIGYLTGCIASRAIRVPEQLILAANNFEEVGST